VRTLKTSRKFKGSPISIRALCGLEDRGVPLSLMDIVTSDGVRNFNGKVKNGDVDCTWDMTIWQNGFWSVKADFHDGGVLAGDFFFAEFVLDRDRGAGTKLEGSILNLIESRHLALNNDGSDRWIRENWQKVEAVGPRVNLHVAPSVGGIILEGVGVLGIAIAFIFGGGGKMFGAERCDDQDLHGPACVHGRIVSNDEGAGDTPSVGGSQISSLTAVSRTTK